MYDHIADELALEGERAADRAPSSPLEPREQDQCEGCGRFFWLPMECGHFCSQKCVGAYDETMALQLIEDEERALRDEWRDMRI